MNTNKTTIALALTTAMIIFQGGCSRDVVPTGFLSNYSTMEAESNSSLRYVNKPALGKYSDFIVDPVEIRFQTGAIAIEQRSEGNLTDQDMTELADYFHDALVKAIADAGCTVAYQPGPHVARVRAAITDMEETNVLLAMMAEIRLLTGAGLGGAGMETEVIDSRTGRQLAAYAEIRGGSRVPLTGLSRWGGAKAAIDAWADRLKQRLTEARTP